jgi:molecular chaperone GrpE
MSEKRHSKTGSAGKQHPADEEEIVEGEVVEVTGEAPESSAAAAGIPEAEYNALAEELQQAQEKAKEYFEGWQRERADFANYKRRIERDQQMLAQNIKGEVVKKYLGVLDDLERAMKNRPAEDATASEATAWVGGIDLIMRKVQAILEAEGMKRIPAETEEFDPNRHEAKIGRASCRERV